MSINIRTAGQNDVEALQYLSNELVKDNAQYDTDVVMDWATGEKGRLYFKKHVSDPNYIVYMAFVDDKPAGYIACALKDIDYRKSKCLEIDSMSVVAPYQSQGIGKLLIDKTKEWAKKRGFQKLFVNAYFTNHRGVSFYKRYGFKEIDISLEINL